MTMQHFLTLKDLSQRELEKIIKRAIELKQEPQQGMRAELKTLGLMFSKASTRTRVAFEVAMNQLGGSAIFLSDNDAQTGRGEPVADTARVISSMVDLVAVRTHAHSQLVEFASHSRVPVINALSDDFHPCQLLADVQTFMEVRGSIRDARVAWIGDGNNMCQSYINAAAVFGFSLSIACPLGYEPNSQLLKDNSHCVRLVDNPAHAARDADLVVTDVWASMGSEAEALQRKQHFGGFQVTQDLMAGAAADALFMHCLPAHRGEEVTAEVIDSTASVVWQEAENRMHSQKALIEFLLS
ncbi:MAG: ornithine carbamoyltransferase [Pseudomonadota bacterium]|nr:ornithine carbamoyltransferase [Pseudomonadota bacterium]